MAKDAKPADDSEVAPKKSKKLLIIILAAVLILLIAGAGAAFVLMSGSNDELDEDEVAEETAKPKKAKKKEKAGPPIFVGLDPFTVNLVPEVGDQYLQVVISVELDAPEAQQELINLMPRIRNNVTLLLSSKKASELLPKDGKDKLAQEVMNEINAAIHPPRASRQGDKPAVVEGPVVSVLFTSFIIQ